MARPVQDADDEVGDFSLLCLRQVFEIDRRLFVEIDEIVGQPAADCDLVHINVRGVEKAAGIGHRDDRESVGAAFGGDRRAFERIERDVDRWAVPCANLLADKEHRRLVALALADDDRTGDRQAVECPSHCVDRGLVGRFFVTPSHPARG